MKKTLTILLSAILLLTFVACGAKNTNPESQASKEDSTTIKISSYNGNNEKIELEVPYNPSRIAVMDYAALDILDNLGVADRVVGLSKGSSIDYLQKYMNNEKIINVGTIKEISLEKVLESEPDLIFIGGRLAQQYDALSEIAPVVYLPTDLKLGLVESTKNNARTIASVFGLEEKIDGLFADFDGRIKALQQVSNGKTAFVGMLSSGSFNVLGNDGRCSIIGVEIGFENIGLNYKSGEKQGESSSTAAHGNETSFEYIAKSNPDYIFVMNRDAAIGTEGAAPAKEVIENDLIKTTGAFKNGNIVYLEHSNVWYTAEGGVTSLDYMLKDLEKALLK